MAELHIAFFDSGLVRGNVDLYVITINLVAKVVGLLLVEGDNKILQAISISFEGLFWFQEFNGIRNSTGENCGSVLSHFI